MKAWKTVELKEVPAPDGVLCVVEGGRDIPFEIRRAFWISGVPHGVSRGNHAMRRTRMLLCAVSGTCEVALRCGGAEETVLLDGRGAGLLIEPQAWRSMCAFSDDCVLLVLCDRYYEAEDIVPAPEQTGPAGPADAG